MTKAEALREFLLDYLPPCDGMVDEMIIAQLEALRAHLGDRDNSFRDGRASRAREYAADRARGGGA